MLPTRTPNRSFFLFFFLIAGPAWAATTWYVAPNGSGNSCSSANPCALSYALGKSSAGDTFSLGPGLYRLSPCTPASCPPGSSSSGYLNAKNNQTFAGQQSCAPASAPCAAVVSGSILIGGTSCAAKGCASGPPDSYGNWAVSNQFQQGKFNNIPRSCDRNWDGCNYPEDLYINGVPMQHVAASSEAEAALGNDQWWFDYSNHIVYFHQDPASVNTIETSVLKTLFNPNGVSGITVRDLTVEEFAVQNGQAGAIDPSFGAQSGFSNGLNWTVKNSYITLNHGIGIRLGAGMHVLNNVVTKNGNIGVGGGPSAGPNITPSGIVIQGNVITYNNYSHSSPGYQAGGFKTGNTANIVFRGNNVSYNIGQGVHFDDDSLYPLVDGNVITYNADPIGQGSASCGLCLEVSFGGAIFRNNYLAYNGNGAPGGPNYQMSSATSVGMEAYCNVIETAKNPGGGYEGAFLVAAANRGRNPNEPYRGEPFRSKNNFVHHNTVIWDPGSIADVGYFIYDKDNQSDFFSVNTPPDYNEYHAYDSGLVQFVYGNIRGTNSATNFRNYQRSGAEPHSTIDTANSKGFPIVTITSPADQSSVTYPVTVSATASDNSGIRQVQFLVDWAPMTTVKTPPYTYTWTGAPGSHVVVAMASSNAGVRNCYAVTLTNSGSGN
jgi:hypothetical protein